MKMDVENITTEKKYDLDDPNLINNLKEDFLGVLSEDDIEDILGSVLNKNENNSFTRKRNK